MERSEYREWAHWAADWGADYLDGLAKRPVRAPVAPGAIAALLEDAPPEEPTPMSTIVADFERIVPGGMTHWQHPRFFAYFPANAAPVSMVAEQLTTAMAAQCMLWQTSPAATEMETVMVDWRRQAVGLPEGFSGTLQDSATTATLCAVLTMRERALDWSGLHEGLFGGPRLRIYASDQTHSSIDKAVRLAGIGQANLVKVPVRDDFGMDPVALAEAIAADRAAGHRPAGIVACTGGTSIGAMDPVDAIMDVAEREDLYVHVDAAWAGSAMICPELRGPWQGVERADSVVFNPHKWLGAQFECTAHLLKDPAALVRTVGLRPDYLVTLGQDEPTNYNEWSVALGRRFRALKVWFLIRAHGLEGLRTRIRNHVAWARQAAGTIADAPELELVTSPSLALFTFAHRDGDDATARLLETVNDDGRLYLTQTTHAGRFAIRMSVGQFDTTEAEVEQACAVIRELAAAIGG
ncbi:MAG: aminotransferase class I/II-fold pyridoxal phosphate-dependent enzyme [Acidobacteriota bacterium]